MNRSVTEGNRIALAFLELARDKTFTHLPEEEKNKLVRKVILIGDEAAGWAAAEYGTSDPRKIAVKMGLRIFGEEKKSLNRSEYRREKKEIAISRKFHEKLLREVQSRELSDRLLKLVVAHELFHHIEADRIGEVYRRFKFTAWKIGPFFKEKMIRSLSDVAAQAFTQTLLGLELTPPVFDYLVMMNFQS